jgi:hypothetical protein
LKQCMLVGVSNLDQCAIHKGLLPEDRIASTLAGAAVAERDGWSASCRKYFPVDDCDALFRRAAEIALRSSVER